MKTIYYLLIYISLLCFSRAEPFVYSSDTARYICDGAEGYTYEERFRLIHTLDNHISMGDVEYYLDFLNRPFEEVDLPEGELNTLKNNLADKLLKQHNLPDKIAECFLQMVDRKVLGVVWRDYVLQKLPDLYECVEEWERTRILKKLWEETGNTNHTHSATALLGLNRISNMYTEIVSSDQITARALVIVKEARFAEQNKIIALQVLAEYKHPEVLNLAREVLNAESTVMLRVSAISVLGIFGQRVDRETLSAYTRSSEFRLRQAAQSALDRLDG